METKPERYVGLGNLKSSYSFGMYFFQGMNFTLEYWWDVLIVGLAKPFRWIINNPESLSQEKIKKEAKLVKLLVQIKELSNFFCQCYSLYKYCRNTGNGRYTQWLEGFEASFCIGDSLSLNFKFRPYFRMTGKMKILFSISIWVSSDWKICMDTCSQGHHFLTSSLLMWLVSQQWAWPVTVFYLILIF